MQELDPELHRAVDDGVLRAIGLARVSNIRVNDYRLTFTVNGEQFGTFCLETTEPQTLSARITRIVAEGCMKPPTIEVFDETA